MKKSKKAVVGGKPTYTSASSLQTVDAETEGSCGRKWWFQKVLGLKSKSSKSQAIGTKTHGLIEHYLKTGELVLNSIAMAGKHYIPDRSEDLLIEKRIWDQQLKLAGIPVEGFIDLVVPPNKDTRHPEVIDWKTTGNMQYAKTGEMLPKTIQMAIYGKWALEYFDSDVVQLSHVYFATKGTPQSKKSTILVSKEVIEEKWEYIETVAGSLHTLAAYKDVNDVPANRDSCKSYGGCPFYSDCPRTTLEVFDMSLIADKPEPSPALKKAWSTIVDAGRGTPPLHGAVAVQLCGSDKLPGKGELGVLVSIDYEATLVLLAKELSDSKVEEPPPPPQILPPDAPKSDPAKAALPIKEELPFGLLEAKDVAKLKKADVVKHYEDCLSHLLLTRSEECGLPTETQSEPATITYEGEPPTLYVNCIPPGASERLEPYISDIVDELNTSAGEDIRRSKKDALSFGKWKGALADAITERPPVGSSFTVVCKGDEYSEIAAQVLERYFRVVRGF